MVLKRMLQILVLLAVLFLVLFQIGSEPEPAEAQGSVIRIALNSDPPSLDPNSSTLVGLNYHSRFVINQIFERLFRYTSDGMIEPANAESLSVDGLVYTVHLRQNAKWSDGMPVTAQQYVDGILRLGAPATEFEFAEFLYSISGFQAYHEGTLDPSEVGVTSTDDYTLKITLESPAAFFPHLLTSPWLIYPVRLDKIDSCDNPLSAPTNCVGNGPYQLDEWLSGDHLTLVKNPEYWNAGSVRIEEIQLPIIPDLSTQFSLYQNDELEVSGYPLGTQLAILADPILGAEFHKVPWPGTYYIGLNTEQGPTDDLDLRIALASAIDRRDLLDSVLEMPWRDVATGMIPPEMLSHQGTSVGYLYDTDKAEEHLGYYMSRTGILDPSEIHLELWYNTGPGNQLVIETVAEMWRDNLYVTVDVVDWDWSTYTAQLESCALDPSGCDYNGFRLGWVADYLDAWDILYELFNRSLDATGWQSNEYGDLLISAAGQSDESQRVLDYQNAERILVEDEAVVIPIYHYDRTALIKPNVYFEYPSDGFAPHIMNWSLDPFVVTNTNDTGTGSFRQGLLNANLNSGQDLIIFRIPSGSEPGCNATTGVCTIQPNSPLPTITDPVIIDGYSQPGASPNTNGPGLGSNASLMIELDGSLVAGSSGLNIDGGASTVQGLVINRFGIDGIRLLTNGGNTIRGNYIGTDVTGATDLGNTFRGVMIFDVPDNTIGGTTASARNIISGNENNGVEISGNGATGNVVQGNFIGTDPSGAIGLGNSQRGVLINNASNNTVESNAIAFNGLDGIRVGGISATGNTLTQNSIHDNIGMGIENVIGGNEELTPPSIDEMFGDYIEGMAPLGSIVEIFVDGNGEGRTFLGSEVASDGTFTFTASLRGPNLTATATDPDGNTSEFSPAIPWAPDNCEPNNTFEHVCTITSELELGPFQSYVSRSDDVDWFQVDLIPDIGVEPGQLVTVTLTGLGGIELPSNYDVALFAHLNVDSTGATPLEAVPLEAVPLEAVPLEAVPLEAVPLEAVPLEAVPLEAVPLEAVPLEAVPLEAVGFHHGSQVEEVSALFRGGMTGTFYILVWSSDGAYSTTPYELTLSVGGVSADPCTTSLDDATMGEPLAAPLGNTSDPATLVLVNLARMKALYPGANFNDFESDLSSLADHHLVDGLVVDLGASTVLLPSIESPPYVVLDFDELVSAYDTWDDYGCNPEAANQVTIEIKRVIIDLLERYPSIQYLTLIGSDTVIPFRRVPDEVVRSLDPDAARVPNEFDYQCIGSECPLILGPDGTQYILPSNAQLVGVMQTQNSPTFADLRLQYYLSDDFYADRAPHLLEHGHELSIPDMAIGRLVEEPYEIGAHIREFLQHDGMMTHDGIVTSLSTGYSFLVDLAMEIDDTFNAKGFDTNSLISEDGDQDPWDREDLLEAYTNPPVVGGVPLVDSVNGHFDHFRTAPASYLSLADPTNEPLLTSQDFLMADSASAGTLFFSVGCHSGLSYPDEYVLQDGIYEDGRLDFAQVFVGSGVPAVLNTGYGYGDTDAILYSEELMLNFARLLGVEGGIGNALVDAKREYLLTKALTDAFHEKILMEAVFYGLPHWQLGAIVPSPEPGITSTLESETQLNAALVAREYHLDVIDGDPDDQPDQLEEIIVTGRGTYFALAGNIQAAVFRPIQPQGNFDIAATVGELAYGKVAHGVLFTGGTYWEVSDFDPFITMPTWDRTLSEPQFLYEGWDPPRFWSLAQLGDGTGNFEERLVLVPGQFLVDKEATLPIGPTVGTERIYDTMDFEVFYAAVGDEFQPPIIHHVDASTAGNPGVFFEVGVADPGSTGPQLGIVRVVVTYTETSGGLAWQTLDLEFNGDTGLWHGTLQGAGAIDFFVQAVDTLGNVGMFAGSGYFTPIEVNVSGPSTAVVGQRVSFEATVIETLSDPSFLWDFGDGAIEAGSSTVLHSYGDPGEYSVKVYVVDSTGNLGNASMEVEITAFLDSSLHDAYVGLIALTIAVEDLPDDALRDPGEDRHQTLEAKIAEVGLQILAGNFEGAINKLENDIRSKLDGCGDAPDKNDWITQCPLQYDLQVLVDVLISTLEFHIEND